MFHDGQMFRCCGQMATHTDEPVAPHLSSHKNYVDDAKSLEQVVLPIASAAMTHPPVQSSMQRHRSKGVDSKEYVENDTFCSLP